MPERVSSYLGGLTGKEVPANQRGFKTDIRLLRTLDYVVNMGKMA